MIFDHPQTDAPLAVIDAAGARPSDEDSEKFAKLIGKALTRVEIRANGVLYLEFDPYGSITAKPTLHQNISASLVEKP